MRGLAVILFSSILFFGCGVDNYVYLENEPDIPQIFGPDNTWGGDGCSAFSSAECEEEEEEFPACNNSGEGEPPFCEDD